MNFDYTIKYTSENCYEHPVYDAFWQYMVIPETNDTQELIAISFNTSIDSKIEQSINGFGFKIVRVQCKIPFENISFDAEFKLIKKEINPFDFIASDTVKSDFESLDDIAFKVDFAAFLTPTPLTKLPLQHQNLFDFDLSKSIHENLIDLNNWTYVHIYFKTGFTNVETLLDDVIENRHGVCQDFSHLFIAIARLNKIPARYVSGFLHQGSGYFGDSQMHAWVEAYIPNIGWIGFDPTNNLLVNHNHIKVSHGRDYKDCAPLKGIVYSQGNNETKHSVEVSHQQ